MLFILEPNFLKTGYSRHTRTEEFSIYTKWKQKMENMKKKKISALQDKKKSTFRIIFIYALL